MFFCGGYVIIFLKFSVFGVGLVLLDIRRFLEVLEFRVCYLNRDVFSFFTFLEGEVFRNFRKFLFIEGSALRI